MAKRKVSDNQEPIVKRSKQEIANMVETGTFVIKEEGAQINQTPNEKRSSGTGIGLFKAKTDCKRSHVESIQDDVFQNDEGPSSLSWLVNLSAASLFTGTQTYQPTVQHCETSSFQTTMKPGLTYTELIEKALIEHGELTVSEIYKWIYSHYPYYKKNDGRWKNSIRHNLSINPQFRKGEKCNTGGHFWTLNKEYDEQFKKWQENKKSIRGEKRKKPLIITEEEEIEIATKSIMLEEDNSNDSSRLHPDTDPSLVRVATDILSGVDKHVEVEYMSRVDSLSAPLIIEEEDIMECVDPMLADPLLFSDCLELGFQPYELIDPRL
nr:fork-head transcriptional regulator 2-like [Halyomorpha halys]